MKESDKLKRKLSMQATKARHKTQTCQTFEVKIQENKLKKSTKNYLKKLFLEAKWLTNYVLGDIKTRIKETNFDTVTILNKDKEPETRELLALSSQMKQGILTGISNNLSGLKKTKDKGIPVGRLKFRKEVNAIPLKQYGVTFQIKGNKIKLQGLKQLIKVHGLEQFMDLENKEIAKGFLIKKPSGLYFKITVYSDKVYERRGSVGIDFNVTDKKQIVLSNGLVLGLKTNKRLDELKKIASRKLSKTKKGSNNRKKAQQELRKIEEKRSNIKKDYENKVFGYIRTFDVVCIQDDDIKGWTKNHGKSVERAGLGRIKQRIEDSLTPKIVDRFFASTKTCSECGNRKTFMSLFERVYICEACGMVKHRDHNSADAILKVGLDLDEELSPAERREEPDEIVFCKRFIQNHYVKTVFNSGSSAL